MFKSKQNNQDYSLAKECVEKYITKPDIKLITKKIKRYWNSLQGNFRLPEELFATTKIEEKDIAFSKIAAIRDYLKFRINQLETRIQQNLSLVKGITIVLVIGLLVNFSVNNLEILMGTRILSISLILIILAAIYQIYSGYYLLAQYRLIQVDFDQESVDNWLRTESS